MQGAADNLWYSSWSRNWQLICLSTAKLCAMIADYYRHFYQVIQLSFTFSSTVVNDIIQYLPNFSWACFEHSTRHFQGCRGSRFIQNCNLYQMYACLSKIRCKKPRTRVHKVPVTGFKIFTCTCWRGFWTVFIFNGTSWAQTCSGYSPFQFSKDQYCPSETIKCWLQPQIPLLQSFWPIWAWRSLNHTHMLKISCLPSDQTC